jgi:hypothetical protein
MKKQVFILLGVSVLALILTGCGRTAEAETIKPIDPATWPTPQRAPAMPSPTPFPKISLADVATPTAQPAAVTADASPPDASPASIAVSDNASPRPVSSQPVQSVAYTAPAASLLPMATLRTPSQIINLYKGPGVEYGLLDELVEQDVIIMAVNPNRDWALVNTVEAGLGWLALADVPAADNLLNNAPEVVTAWVNSNELTVRTAPGIFADPVGTVAINSLMLVQGVNEARSWAHISQPTGNGSGWLPLQFLTVNAAISNLPVYVDAVETIPAETAPAESMAENSHVNLENSKLVLQLSSGGEIVTIKPDGSNLRRLTSGIDPALSPNGQTVAFTRWQGDNGSLWVMDVDGSNERQVLGFTKQPKGAAWSPDGSQIVINFQHEGRLEAKTICHDLSEGDPPNPPANAYGYLDENGQAKVSVDIKGKSEYDVDFCYTLPPDPHWGLRTVTVADGSYEDLDGGTYAFRPTWDPAQPWRIVSDGGHGLLATDVNQKSHQKLSENVDDGSPVFSPNGQFIALSAGQPGGGSQGHDIYRLNSDGSGRIRLTQTPLWAAVQPDQHHAWNNVAPAWSPDGNQIAFLTDRAGRWEVWVMNADGSNPHAIFSEAVNDQLSISYNFVDERAISWQ